MRLPTFAKAIVSAAVAGAAPTLTAVSAGQPVNTQTTVASVVSAIVGAALTYAVPNRTVPTEETPPLQIHLGLDSVRFLQAFSAGVPTLVSQSAKSALTPVAPATPPSAP